MSPASGPDPARSDPLSPDAYRRLQDAIAEAQAFAHSFADDDAAPAPLTLSGFEVTDLRRFLGQLREARACDDPHAEHVARALIAGYIRAVVDHRDGQGPTGA